MYDIKDLEAFVSVAKTESLTTSTRDLNLPKSTLSRRLRQLEEAVGQSLLSRQSKGIAPNAAGRVFYRYANEILMLVTQGQEALDELKAEVKGKLVLRCHEALLRGWFSDVVKAFTDEHPGVRVAVHTQQGVPADLSDGACVWIGDPGDVGLRQELLGELTQGVYGNPDYLRRHGGPRSPADLCRHPWVDILGDSEEGLQLKHSRLGAYPLNPPEEALTVDQYVLQGDAIAGGRGLGLMPHWLVNQRLRHHPGSFELCIPEWQGPPLPVTLLYPHGTLPRRIRAFVSHVRAAVPSDWGQSAAIPSVQVPETGTHHATT